MKADIETIIIDDCVNWIAGNDDFTTIVQSPMRKMMFMLTFVSIGVITGFSKLKGMGKPTLLYAVALIAVIAPIAYIVAIISHHGMMPPLVSQ